MKRSKEQVLSDFVYGLTKKLSKDKKVELDAIYTSEWGEYFANYLNTFQHKRFEKEISPEEAVEKLNESFIKDVQGSYIPLVRRRRDVVDAFEMFQSVCASVRLQIKNKYGVEDFYSLKDSENKKAREECLRFEEFAKSGEKTLTKHQLNEHYYKLSKNNPKAMQNQSFIDWAAVGMAVGSVVIGEVVFILENIEGEQSDRVNRILFFGPMVGAVPWYFVFKRMNENDAIDGIFKSYGIYGRDNAYDYLNDYLMVMPMKEKQQLIDAIIENNKLTIAHKYGFSNVEDAFLAAQSASSQKEITLNEALNVENATYQLTRDSIAQRYGFTDYNDAMLYLADKKTRTNQAHKYTELNANAMSREFEEMDDVHQKALESIKNQTWPQTQTDYGDYNNMMSEFKAVDIIKEAYYDKMLSSDNYAYGTDNAANVMYADFVDHVGVDKANKLAGIPTKQVEASTIGADYQAVSTCDVAGVDASALEALAVGGIALGAAFRLAPGIIHYFRGKKMNEKIAVLEEQEKQEEQDQSLKQAVKNEMAL